jgi:polyisoprenoid-binding protein YceI
MLARFLILLIVVVFSVSGNAQPYMYEGTRGTVSFRSNAPRELISSVSHELTGIIDIKEKTFAFRVRIASFEGFNNELQQEHFDESYMETARYPNATYTGKIIEDIDLTKDGEYTIRAKGKMKIHGVELEKIIKTKVTVKGGKVVAQSDFTISLSDFDIKIPRVVYDKLAHEIKVKVFTTLLPKRK